MADSLNTWIKEVENHLTDLSPGERASIIVELDAQLRKHPLTSYEELIRTFGTPAQVANRFRLQLGKNPFQNQSQQSPQTGTETSIVRDHYQNSAPSSRPVGSSARRFFKFATFAILGLFTLFVASIFLIPLMIFKFIAVDNFEKDFTFSFGDHKTRMERLQGKLSANPLTSLTITLTNGQVATTTDPKATEITYECEIESDNIVNEAEVARIDNSGATIALLNVESADCDITLPPLVQLSVNVTSGRIALNDVEQNVEANLTNGEIEFEASDKASFQMAANVQKGSVDGLKSFESDQKKKLLNAKEPQFSAALSVGSGRIDIE